MSEEERTGPSTEELEQAFSNVWHGAHKQAYFHRLRQHGRAPKNEKEAEDLLRIGAQLERLESNPAVKQATDDESRFAKASKALDSVLAEQSLSTPPAEQEGGPSMEAKAAAWELAQDATLFESAALLYDAQEQAAAAAA